MKPRQCGFSTLVGGMFSHRMFTDLNFYGLAMADKHDRTQSIASIYKYFYENLPDQLKPSVTKFNTEEVYFDIFKSGISFMTGNDPQAGRSGTRKFGHLSEWAFIRYTSEIDEGVQNSIPLDPDTYIIKESTANGKSGLGKAFYDLWNAAKRGDSIYKPFFVAWYEVDDYKLPLEPGFSLSREEKDLIKRIPPLTKENLQWRRMKITEYATDENSLLSPEERFNQDFPVDDVTAFLSTGSPLFSQIELDKKINTLKQSPKREIQNILTYKNQFIRDNIQNIKIYSPPRENKQYFLGADVSEGLAMGDASTISVIDENYTQVFSYYGKLDPDLFGHLIVAVAEYYKNALVTQEVNNMGHTTMTTIRNEGYTNVYRKMVEDKITKEKTTKIGWRTTKESKQDMLNHYCKLFRDGDLTIFDVSLLIEMTLVTRGDNGIVELNGKDRVVAMGLACMGRKATSSLNIKRKGKSELDKIQAMFNPKKKDRIF